MEPQFLPRRGGEGEARVWHIGAAKLQLRCMVSLKSLLQFDMPGGVMREFRWTRPPQVVILHDFSLSSRLWWMLRKGKLHVICTPVAIFLESSGSYCIIWTLIKMIFTVGYCTYPMLLTDYISMSLKLCFACGIAELINVYVEVNTIESSIMFGTNTFFSSSFGSAL